MDDRGVFRREIAESLRRGRASLSELEGQIGSGLSSTCRDCHRRATDLAAALLEVASALSDERRRRTADLPKRRVSRSSELADLAIERLRTTPGWARRREIVRQQHFTLRGPHVARAFLVEARKSLPSGPEDAARWASLVPLAVGSDRSHFCRDDMEQTTLTLHADLFQANGLRCQGQFERAAAHLQRIEVEATAKKVFDVRFWAEHRGFLASLQSSLRQFASALAKAKFSAMYWEAAGSLIGSARMVLQSAVTHEQAGDFPLAAQVAGEAVTQAERTGDEALIFQARHTHSFYLARAGFFEEAAAAALALAPAYSQFPWAESRRLWGAALVAAGSNRLKEAEEALSSARQAFVRAGSWLDAGLVVLDTCEWFAVQGREDAAFAAARAPTGWPQAATMALQDQAFQLSIRSAIAQRGQLPSRIAEVLLGAFGA
jgi:hypothetical protein